MSKSTGVLDELPRKMLAAGSVSVAKADRKPLAEEWQVLLGQAIECALRRARITKQDAAYRMGYGTNQAPLSRWISGAETPQFAKLFSIPELRMPLCVELAELSGAAIHTRVEWPMEKAG